MSERKSFSFLKLLGILCLIIAGITEITIMTDNAEDYSKLAKLFDAEYMSVVYYVVGFSFLIIAVSALFSLGKRSSSVISASIEFLIILGLGYYLREYFEPNQNMDKVAYLILVIPVVYVEEFTLSMGLSAAALVFGILDTAVGSSFSVSSPINECIYCGRRLRPGEKCTCDLDDTYVVNDFDTDPENYADDVEKRKCVFCGRLLYGTEKCNCSDAKRAEAEAEIRKRGTASIDTPTYTPPAPRDVYSPVAPATNAEPESGKAPRKGMFINKEFKTNPSSESGGFGTAPSEGAHTPSTKKPSDNKFFSKPDDI